MPLKLVIKITEVITLGTRLQCLNSEFKISWFGAYKPLKITIPSIIGAILAIIVGLIIVKISLGTAPLIRDNIVSCIPEELSATFDREQSAICSKIGSLKTDLVIGGLLGLGLIVIGLVIALASIIPVINHTREDRNDLHL
jgi:hypothetical protein